jgi:drug/metabolite transporter (DMT)-like permease
MPSSLVTVGLIAAGGAMQFLNVFFSYKSMSVGKVSIVSPVASSSAIVSVALAIAILGEQLSVPQLLCIVAVIVGILAAASAKADKDDNSLAGIQFALVSAFTGGIYSILIKLISRDIGAIGTLVTTRILVVIIIFSLYPLLTKQQTGKITLSFRTVVVAALSGFLGYFGRIIGISIGLVAIVAPVSSASPATTVILSQILLKERLAVNQKIGSALVIFGVVLLAAFTV